jgi:hypothetical protein
MQGFIYCLGIVVGFDVSGMMGRLGYGSVQNTAIVIGIIIKGN